jgi:hypothetical protein
MITFYQMNNNQKLSKMSLNNPPKSDGDLLCCYVNRTSKIEVARITNIPNWYFERVVFPGQQLIFEAKTEANLEIHSGMMASSILSDTISCEKLILDAEVELQTIEDSQSAEYRNEAVLTGSNLS